MKQRKHHHVYVIALSKDVLYEAKFKKCNPDYITGKSCFYVGMTGLDPDIRFDKHSVDALEGLAAANRNTETCHAAFATASRS